MDLRTNYLGLELKNPLVPSASPLSRSLDTARALEDAGASALVMYSLFEEELQHQQLRQMAFLADQGMGHSEADSYLPVHAIHGDELDNYLEQIRRLKESLSIPVIASLNGISLDGWIEHGTQLYTLRSDTFAQMAKGIRELLADAFPEDRAALLEAEAAINEVLEQNKQVELAPQRARLRRLQHELVKHHGLQSKSEGEEPFRRLVVYPV